MEKQIVDIGKLKDGDITLNELLNTVLGVKRAPSSNGQAPRYGFAPNSPLAQFIWAMMEQFEKEKRKRLGLKENRVLIPNVVPNPLKKG